MKESLTNKIVTSGFMKPQRIASIDVYRALTMFFMIFVNDFWSITGVPHWLEHAAAEEDMLGFSDIVFPSFLFVLGMSIPLAIDIRIGKDESKFTVLRHIFIRSLALLIMGLFTVNTESGVASVVGISKPVFVLCMLLGFFLIWNSYPQTENKKKRRLYSALKIAGVAILAVLIFIFRDSSGGGFQPRWWGILGLIGWTYFLCAIIYLFFNKKRILLVSAFLFFILLCIAGTNKWLGVFDNVIPGNGCFHAFTMAGMLISLLFNKSESSVRLERKVLMSIATASVFFCAGYISRSFWIISKIQATPTWLFLCAGISILFYVFIYWLVDLKNKKRWFNIIEPAGTATLTCYLIPYFLYSIFAIIHFSLPAEILISPVGLIKCAFFSFFTIGVAALLSKIGIKLKI